MAHTRYRINLLFAEEVELDRLIRKHTTPQQIAKRARIILYANGNCATNQEIANEIGMYKSDVTRWTKRWVERGMEPVIDRLSDLPRSGHPDVITPEQWCLIMAMACEPPEQHGRPISHWSSTELAAEAIKQGIVESLSPGHLRKVLKKNFTTSPQPLLAERQGRRTQGRAHCRHLRGLPECANPSGRNYLERG